MSELTTEQKLSYIGRYVKLLEESSEEGCLYMDWFLRGMLAAYSADMSISSEDYSRLSLTVEEIVRNKKRKRVNK